MAIAMGDAFVEVKILASVGSRLYMLYFAIAIYHSDCLVRNFFHELAPQ